jgi:predicted esterase
VNGICQGFDRDFLSAQGGEAAIRPESGLKSAGSAWRIVVASANDDGSLLSDRLDFLSAYGPVTDRVAYAFREFEADAAGDYVLRFGSDDGAMVWLNGELVHVVHSHRELKEGEDLVAIRLRSGTNKMLVKVDQGYGDWGFSASVSSAKDERARAAASEPIALKIEAGQYGAGPGREIRFTVMSEPAAFLEGEALVDILDGKGRTAASARVPLSRLSSMKAPSIQGFAMTMRASGLGKLSRLAPAAATLLAGNPAEIFKSEAARAREASTRSSPWFDAGASLGFLALQLEGRLQPSLVTYGRQLEALKSIDVLLGLSDGAKALPAGVLRLAFRSELDGSLQPYSLFVPPGFDPRRRYPLLVFLHGRTGDDQGALAPFAKAAAKDFIVLAPFGRGDLGYQGPGEVDVLEALEAVASRFPIDRDRIYVAGSSMGGFGAQRIAQLHPDLFAGMASFAGWSGPQILTNLRALPVLLVHGDADDNVPDALDRVSFAVLKELGAPARLDSLPGVGHDAFSAWTAGKGADRLLEFFRPLKRQAWPKTVSAAATRARYGGQYWVTIAGLASRTEPGMVKAQVDDERHLTVDTSLVTAFSLDLRHPLLASKGRILCWVDGRTVAVDAGTAKASFALGASGFFERQPQGAPEPYSIGGLREIFARPLYVVYGSAVPGKTARLKAIAGTIADLSPSEEVDFGDRSGRPRIVSDKEFNPVAAGAASVLFIGKPAENSALAALRGLPISWGKKGFAIGNTEYRGKGLIAVCPYPGKEGALAGVIDMPIPAKAGDRILLAENYALREFAWDGDPTGTPKPDIAVFDPKGGIISSFAIGPGKDQLRPF